MACENSELSMKVLKRQDLMSLEAYTEERDAFRKRVLEHKKHRRIDIGPNFTLYFEDRLTIQYQVQEMLRIEKTFTAAGIEEELEAYNPLIPNGTNLKATAMLEFEDVEVRRRRLAELVGMEHQVWIQVAGHAKTLAISNEDLDRSTDEKTAAVHFMRFELTDTMIQSLKAGAALSFGSDHPGYRHQVSVAPEARAALLSDLD